MKFFRLWTFVFFTLFALTMAIATIQLQAEDVNDQVIFSDGNTTMTLSQFNSIIKDVEKKQGTKLTADQKKQLLGFYAQRVIIYRHAVEQGLDKSPEVAFKIRNAIRETVVESFLDDYLTKGFPTEDEYKAYYEKNKERYNRPAIYNGFFYIIEPSKKAGDCAKSDAAVAELTSKIVEGGYKPVNESVISDIRKTYADCNIVFWSGNGYYKGKRDVTVPQPAIDAYLKLAPMSLATLQHQNQQIIAVLENTLPVENLEYDAIKNTVKSELNTETAQKKYADLINKLEQLYDIKIKFSLLD